MVYVSIAISVFIFLLMLGLCQAVLDVAERVDDLWHDYIDEEIECVLDYEDPDVPWWINGEEQ